MAWPDIAIGAVALLFTVKGWRRGFVAEIGGFIALACAIWAAIFYRGTLDDPARDLLHVGGGSAHVVGMIAFAVLVYAALLFVASVLSRVAKLPIIGLGNALGGAAVGLVKALLGVWALLYVVLFFPLTPDLRGDLRRSGLVAVVTQPNGTVDNFVRGAMPWFVRPLVEPLFEHHRM